MQLTGELLVKACRSVRVIRKRGHGLHTQFTSGQIPGHVDPRASTHGGHGHSIDEGGKS